LVRLLIAAASSSRARRFARVERAADRSDECRDARGRLGGLPFLDLDDDAAADDDGVRMRGNGARA
jgi:hypothetical protein